MNEANDANSEITRLIMVHRASLYGFILGYVPDVNAVEDVFQDVCVAVCQDWKRFDTEKPFLPWAMGIARNRILRHFDRAAKDRMVLMDQELAELIAENPGWQQEPDNYRQALLECMDKLTARARQFVDLRYYTGYSVQQIASNLGVGPRSVSVALTRARKALASCVRAAREGGG